MSDTVKPRLFVGSSVEGISIAYAVQQNLEHHAEVTVWDQGIFSLSNTALDSLLQVLERSDFSVFIFTPDDIIKIRGEEGKTVRDNVVFELGLFIGRLGKERSFILIPRGEQFLHLPTDLIGVTPGTFETDRTDGNFQAATGPACHLIRQNIAKLGPLSKSSAVQTPPGSDQNYEVKTIAAEQTTVEAASSAVKTDQPQPSWIAAFFAKRYDEAISLLEKEIAKSEDNDQKLAYKSWLGRAKAGTDFQSGLEYLIKLKDENPEHDEPYLAGDYSQIQMASEWTNSAHWVKFDRHHPIKLTRSGICLP